MNNNSPLKYTFSFFLILLLFICFPSVCITGASRGLLLWFNTILPTLFPFFLITRLILFYNLIPRKLVMLYPILTGLIAGYPIGAITINELIRDNKIDISKAQILMILCNNASPGFLIGIASLICPERKYFMWFCTICASSIVTLLYALYIYRISTKKTSVYFNRCLCNSITENKNSIPNNSFITSLETNILACFKTLVIIGGYIIIFSILSDYICLIISDSDFLTKGILTGICEMTTGVTLISSNTTVLSFVTHKIYISATAFLCSFGGICALMQTAGSTEQSGLSIKKYTFHKIICGLVAGLLAYII